MAASAENAPAAASTPSFEGHWVRVSDSAMEVYLPAAWTVSPSSAVPVGLLAEDAANGVSMRLSLRASEDKSVDELCDAYTADSQYANVRRADMGGTAYVVFDLPALDAYMGVTDVGYVQIFTFTFAPKDAPGLRALAEEIMASLRVADGSNG